jgi:hypothetical protein
VVPDGDGGTPERVAGVRAGMVIIAWRARCAYRLRAELEELTGKAVQLNMVKDDGPPKGRKEIQIGSGHTAV